MKKSVMVLLTAFVTFAVLFAGGAKENTATVKDSDVNLTIAIWDKNQEPGLTKIVQDFTAKRVLKPAYR